MMKWTAIILLLALHAHAEEIRSTTTQDSTYVQDDDFKPYVGLLAGAATSKDADDSSGEVGFEAGVQMRPIALAAEFSASEFEDAGQMRDKTNLILKGQYHFSGESFTRYTFLGLAAGIILDSNDTDFTLGPLAGFDVPVMGNPGKDQVTLGAVAKYLFTNSTPKEGVALNGSIKYWF